MAKSEFVLNIGDDNVVLIKLVNKKFANAWLASPDSATALEELGEAFAEDKKGRVSIIVDTLDQSNKEEEIPKVGVLDRRKVLSRHIAMAFPGANLRGARFVKETAKKTMLYEFAAVPLDGRIPGWIDYYDSLPNEKGGIYAIASENADLLAALTPKDAPAVTEGTHWRHFIGINVTGGLRQIIEKNGRLSLTRLTQAPPADTPSDEFADMIVRDFKATITYLRRMGYVVGDALDLVVLTSGANKAALEGLTWDGARSVSIMTPSEAGLMLGLGSIGPEDQAFSDVLHAAWFANKRRPTLPLTRSVALGTAKDDLRELAFVASPYVAALAAVGLIGWTGWTTYEYVEASGQIEELEAQLSQQKATLTEAQAKVATLPFDAGAMRNLFAVEDALDVGKLDVIFPMDKIFQSLQSEATVLKIDLTTPNGATRPATGGPAPSGTVVNIATQLAKVVTKADEATQIARRLEKRLTENFGKDYKITMTREPVAAQASEKFEGGLGSTAMAGVEIKRDDSFYADYQITSGGR